MIKVGDKVTPLEDHYLYGTIIVAKDEIYEVIDIEEFLYADNYAITIYLPEPVYVDAYTLMDYEVAKVNHTVVE